MSRKRGRAAALAGGLVAIVVAFLPPVDRASAELFSAHMAQHLLLIVVAAPLLVLGRPVRAALRGLPPGVRRRLVRPGPFRAVGRVGRAVTRPVPAWVLFTIVLWAWHLPSPYEAAIRNEPIHWLEHVSFLGTAALAWSVVLRERAGEGLGTLGRALFLVATAVQSGLLGALLLFAPTPLYPVHGAGPASWGLTPLEDQQLAGAIMWIPPGAVYLVVAAVLLARWFRSMDARRGVIITGVLAVVAAVCTYAVPPGPQPYQPPLPAPTAGEVALGRTLFQQDCAWCHGSGGEGTGYGPDLNGELDGGAYTDFMLRTGRMPLRYPAEEVTLRRPPRYDDQEIAALVAFVETLGGTGPAVPTPNPAAGDLSAGAELYLENCAACHSSTGIGGALTSGQVVPPLGSATPREVAEAMLVGPGCPTTSPTCGPGEGAMPRFDLTQEEVDSIVRYVQYLQDPADPGGASIGRIGPVAEGAVGLIVGLGLLLLVGRWIGTRVGQDDERP